MQDIKRPVTHLRCHPKWFEREVVSKRRRFTETDGKFVTSDWPQSLITLDDRLPPEGFYAA